MKEIILICSFLFLFSACDDYLDIEPQQAISTNVALSDEQGVRTALIGTYDILLSSEHVILNSELLADTEDLIWTSFIVPLTELLNKNIAVSNNNVENFWIYSYRIINQANTVLDAVGVVAETDRDAVAAELRFIRALVYFDLINMYAKPWTAGNPESSLGVPIVSIPAEESLDNPEVPRNNVAEVYEFIIADLIFAKANLPEQNGVFANTYTASALLSRVYLMQEKFESASAEAARVITSGRYELLDDLSQVFNQSDNSVEDIFTIQITPQDFNPVSNFYSGELEGGNAFIGVTDEHLTKYDTGDLRAKLFYNDLQTNTRRTSKWRVNATKDGNITTIRLAEMYLTRAEARFRTGDPAGALEDVNVIRRRAGLLSLSDVDLDVILEERYLELIFEGHQFRDIKRTRRFFGGIPFDDPQMIYPIPQRELDVNGALLQNEGY
ncbi:MAG: RagB/SusD family nutrient uptake outer membrane protein [Saprospiraceae bacterium]|nr:RagB/SusD family nutrient uptake outer membrane protein [Saprospiraceae bacterium]